MRKQLCKDIIFVMAIISPPQYTGASWSNQLSRLYTAVADPGFPRGGGANPKGAGGANLLFGQFFPKTAWKWRNLGPEGGGRASLAPPLRSATAQDYLFCFLFYFLPFFLKKILSFPWCIAGAAILNSFTPCASDKAAGCLKLDLPTKHLTCFLLGIVTSNCHIVLLTLSTFEVDYLRQIIHQYKSKCNVLILFNTQQQTLREEKIS